MTPQIRKAAPLLLLLAAACAGAGGAQRGSSDRYYQADQKMPSLSAFKEDAERAFFRDMQIHESRAEAAQAAGNQDQARAELAAAADGYASMRERFGASEWQIPIAYRAAELYVHAQQYEKAGLQAEKVAADPYAKDRTKAMGYHLAAVAWLQLASQQVKANQLEPIKLAFMEQRGGAPLAPRVPPGAWKRFVDATDRYLPLTASDPELQRPPAERRWAPPERLALIAAEVEYAFDNMEDAQRRFAALLDRWPAEGEIVADAVPLYLQTFQQLGDDAGYQAAVAKVKALVEAQTAKAGDPKEKAAFEKVREALSRADAGARFGRAQALLEEGKAAEAARSFEELAAEGGGDTAGALHNAALAWDKAGDDAKAVALRERIIQEFPAARVTPTNMLLVAAQRSRKGQHLEAAKIYEGFVAQYPENPNRCLALQNWAAELDTGKKPLDAAERYLVFGKDEACAKADPNFAARALYRSGQLFSLGKKPAKAKEAFAATVAVQGVTDTVAKSQVEDARRRMGK